MNQPTSQGYEIFQRKPGRGNFYIRFSIKGQGQKKFSLGTADPDEARKRAHVEWYKTVGLAEMGLAVTKKSFEVISEEFIQAIELGVERGERATYHAKDYPAIIRRYFVGKFGNRQLASITAADLEEYWQWRHDYWISGEGSHNATIRYTRTINGRETSICRPVKEGHPSRSTLNKEAMLLRQLFEFAQLHKYVLNPPKIILPKSKKREITSKPGFTLKEFLHLVNMSETRTKEAEDKPHYFDRLKLHSYVMIAAFTGMRPTELKNLSWGDIGSRSVQVEKKLAYDAIIIQVRGKGKEREMAAMPETITFFNMMRQIFMLQAEREPEDVDPVFFNNQGKRIDSFKKGLAELLEAANLRHHRDGRKRDSGSFRHFYITQQLREGVGQHLLGRNTGTSPKMMDTYYSKVQPTDQIPMLTPDWLKQRAFKVS